MYVPTAIAEALATETAPAELLRLTTGLMAEFTKSIEAITGAGEDGATKRLSDGMAEVLKAVARRIES